MDQQAGKAESGAPALDATARASHGVSLGGRFVSLLGAQGVREGWQAVFFLLLARRSGEEFGQFLLAIHLAYFVYLAGEMGLTPHLSRLLAQRTVDASGLLMKATLLRGLFGAVSLVVLAVFVAGQGYAAPLATVVMLVALAAGMDALAESCFAYLRVAGRQGREGVVRSLAASVAFAFGLAALAGSAPLWLVALFRPLESAMNLAGAAWTSDWRARGWAAWRRASPGRELLSLWRGGLWLSLVVFCGMAYNKINLLFLQAVAGSEAVGLYGAAWQLVDGLAALVSGLLLGKVLFPHFLSLGDQPAALAVTARRTFGWLLLASLPLMLVLWTQAPWLLTLLYGDGFAASARLLPWLTPSIILAFLHNLAVQLMMAMGQSRLLLCLYLAGLGLNLSLCGLLIPGQPLEGAVAALMLTKLAMALATVSCCQRRLGLVSLGVVALGLAAALAAWLLYAWAETRVPGLAALALALIPLALAAWGWRRWSHD